MNNIIQQYKKEKEKYEACCQKIELLIKELLNIESIRYHKIESRTKDIESLNKKIISKGGKYQNINDITDIVALRIITYFEDEVESVAKIINDNFIIDEMNSCDKRKLPLNEFGYRSLHYVVDLNTERQNLKEYERFKNIKIEIQIRSILQHAWAEIEHDLGYKGVATVPDSFKRNFCMIAAQLEMADRDFIKLRDESLSYKEKSDTIIKNEISENLSIDSISLTSFISNNKLIKEINNEIAQKWNLPISDSTKKNIEYWIYLLDFFAIKDINTLFNKLEKYKNDIILLGKNFPEPINSIINGWPIPYLCYALIMNEDINKQNEFFRDILSNNYYDYKKRIENILNK